MVGHMLYENMGNAVGYALISTIFATILTLVASLTTTEKSILDALTKSYDSNARPTSDSREATNVKIDFKLSKIVKLDIREQQLQTNGRILMRWTDINLKWNRSMYNDTDRLVAPSSLFWTPDVLLYNTAHDESVSGSDVYKANLQIDENGTVTWMSPVTLKSSCDMDVKWFPFDTQTCSLLFGSISMTKKKLNLQFYSKPGSVSALQSNFHYTNGVWSIQSVTPQIRDEIYPCCVNPFSLIEIKLSLKRLPMYYVLYLVLPCVCLSLMSPCIFFVPPESGERIGFGITIVLAMSVYLLVISDKLPEKSNESPLIGVLYTELFFVMIGTLLAVVFTTHIAYKITKPPRKIRHIFCNKCIRKQRKQKEIDVGQASKSLATHSNIEMENIAETDGHATQFSIHRRKTLSRTTSGLHREFTFLSPEEEKEMKNQDQWKEIAERIDRINFWIFATLTIALPLLTAILYLA